MSNVFLLLVHIALAGACQRDFSHAHIDDIATEELATRGSSLVPSLTDNEAILANAIDNVSLSTWSSYYTHGDHLAGQNKSMA